MTKMVLVMVMMSSTRHQDFDSHEDLGDDDYELHLAIGMVQDLVQDFDNDGGDADTDSDDNGDDADGADADDDGDGDDDHNDDVHLA